uniref:CARD domain-containing protein n=1 Tax=Zosterops lateralis melanops TaxID=1220523 RepID=A0A8D2PM29_ZOSLA
ARTQENQGSFCDCREDNDEICWNNLENFRVKLISVIDPSRITPYLRQCKVLSPDDEEQVLNDPSLVMRKRKAGVLLDILQRTGHKGFEAFMESLELYYPQLYKKITGKEPSRVFSMIIGNVCALNNSSSFGAAEQSQEHSLPCSMCALEGFWEEQPWCHGLDRGGGGGSRRMNYSFCLLFSMTLWCSKAQSREAQWG